MIPITVIAKHPVEALVLALGQAHVFHILIEDERRNPAAMGIMLPVYAGLLGHWMATAHMAGCFLARSGAPALAKDATGCVVQVNFRSPP